MYRIVESNDPALRKVAKTVPIEEIHSKHIQKIIEEMKHILSKEELGVALAAPQIGESLRIFVVAGHALAKRKERKEGEKPEPVPDDIVFINPDIVKISTSKKDKHEGCLSLKGKWGMVPRAEKATVRAYDEHGKLFTRGASGFLAHIFQHEMDHLEGVLYTDKAKLVYDDKDAEKILEETHD